jgi:putative flippase GtrA
LRRRIFRAVAAAPETATGAECLSEQVMIERLPLKPQQRVMIGQVIRFGLVGGFVTGLYAVVYSPLAKYGITSPQVANFLGYLAAMVTGYVLHSRWSFRGHGTRGNPKRTTSRFFLVSLVS